MNTSMPTQQQDIKAQEDPQQNSEEEIEVVIEDELPRHRRENECLRLMQEQMAKRKAMTNRAQIIQQ
jgi:hypothetical protein